MPRNLSISDITDESHFIIVNPEEIGRQISRDAIHVNCKQICNLEL